MFSSIFSFWVWNLSNQTNLFINYPKGNNSQTTRSNLGHAQDEEHSIQPLNISRYEGYWTSATFNLTCLFKIYAALEVDEVGDPGDFRVSLKMPFQLIGALLSFFTRTANAQIETQASSPTSIGSSLVWSNRFRDGRKSFKESNKKNVKTLCSPLKQL